jgi:hypothetical protein
LASNNTTTSTTSTTARSTTTSAGYYKIVKGNFTFSNNFCASDIPSLDYHT